MARAAGRRRTTRAVGFGVEARVVRYLERRGLEHLAANISCRYGELDLVMLDDETLVFVEVRYRGHRSLVESALTVTRGKQGKLIRTASYFLATNAEHADRVCRFDVVGVDRTRLGLLKVRWIRDAFRVPG